MIGRVIGRLRAVWRRGRLDAEMEEEIRAHLEFAAEEHQRAGMSPGEAERAARRDFGRVERVRERHRDALLRMGRSG